MAQPSGSNRPALPVSIVKPVLLGLTGFILLYALINDGTLGNEMVRRYLAGHTVSRVTTALFLVGLSSLALIAWDVLRQRRLLPAITLRTRKEEANETESDLTSGTEKLQGILNSHRTAVRQTWLWRRLYTALEYIRRNGNADGLDDELKYASELDEAQKQERYSFARIMIWAIPMLGFLGTVLGISEALGGLDIGEDNNFQDMMAGLRSSLYVAFDTTALALTLAIVLMFVQFAVDRFESGLLTLVESRARDELSLHWDITNQSRDSYVQAVEAIGAQVVESSENLVERQVELWRSTIEGAESAWVESVRTAQDSVQESLQQSLKSSLALLGENLDESIQQSDEAVARRWEQWQLALSENARMLVEYQRQMLDHADLVNQSMDKISDLAETREALREFLTTSHSTSDFSEATKQLATAIRLLEFRCKEMDPSPDSAPRRAA